MLDPGAGATVSKTSTDTVASLARPSRAEWELLAIIAKLGRPSLPQILEEALKRDRVLDYYSSRTLLVRLLEKGYLETVKGEGRSVHYVPRVDCEEVLKLETERFLDEVVADDRRRLEVVCQVLAERLRKVGEESE